jgi:hypothetical protein
MRQNFRTGELDILTPGELAKALHEHFHESRFMRIQRMQLAGMRALKLPRIQFTATTTNFILGEAAGSAPCGPEQGYIWLVRRILVASNVISDQASFQLYAGSDATASPLQLVDVVGNHGDNYGPLVQVPTPAVSTTVYGNPNAFPVYVTLAGGVGITAVTVNGGLVLTGNGTFLVPAFGTYSVTFSTTAPTATTAYYSPPGMNVNEAYYPGNKALWVWAGEQLYANLQGATVGNVYSLSGVALEVPTEMQGKIIS